MGYTECSTAKRSSAVPMWDSSDPTRAPPSMPLVTDLPSLTPTGSLASGSYFRLNGRADESVRPGLERRPSSFINESRILKILEATRDIKSGNEKVISSVQSRLDEVAGLTKQTQDAASGLAGLVIAVEATRGAAQNTVQISSDNFPQILKLLATNQESQIALSSRVELLLGEVKKLGRQNEAQQSHVRQLLQTQEAMAGSLAISADRQLAVRKSTSTVSEELDKQNGTMKKQQDEVALLLERLHEDHKESFKSIEVSHVNGLVKVQDEIQASIVKACHDLAESIAHKPVLTNDHLIPELAFKLAASEQMFKTDKEAMLCCMKEEFQQNSKLHQSQTKLILAQMRENGQSVTDKLDLVSKSMTEHHETALKSVTEGAEEEIKTAQAEAKAAELRVVELEATVKKLELQLAIQAEQLKTQTQAAKLDAKAKLAEAVLDAGRRVSAAELRASEAETQRSVIESELKTQRYFYKTIEHHEQDLAKLEEAIETLQAKKSELTGNVSELNTTCSLKADQLKELEMRIESYERRLNQAIVDQSKSILGSTAMSSISAGAEQHSSQASKKAKQRSMTPTSFIRRHLSLRARNDANMEPNDDGSGLSLQKRNSQRPAKHSKSRSVSLFPDFKS